LFYLVFAALVIYVMSDFSEKMNSGIGLLKIIPVKQRVGMQAYRLEFYRELDAHLPTISWIFFWCQKWWASGR
jgi:hypothetical protein